MRRRSVTHHRSKRCAAVLLWMACTCAVRADSRPLPYQARVTAPGAPMLSGPGEKFYAVDTLAQGERIEVHRDRADGWLGIRPPADSFSWIAARHVKLLDNGLAEVEADGVASRIGSRLGDQRNAVQVRLKKGELVEIIGQHAISGQGWYKISPPAGEFRWIHRRYISDSDEVVDEPQLQSPIVTVPVAGESASADDSTITLAADAQPASDRDWHAAGNDSEAAAGGNGAADLTAPPLAANSAASVAPDAAVTTTNAVPPITTVAVPESATPVQVGGALDRYAVPPPPDASAVVSESTAVRQSPAPPQAAAAAPFTLQPATQPGVAADGTAPAASASPTSTAGPVPDSLSRQLTELEMHLSRVVAEPPTNWQIEPLASEAERLLAQTQTVPERAAVQTTLAKIDRFAAIGRRYRFASATSVASGDTRTGAAGSQAGGDPRTTGNIAPMITQFNPSTGGTGQLPITPIAGATPGIVGPDGRQYDAVGILRPVVSKRPGAPQFALLNDRGQVVSFVTPTPDVNLQPYVGHRVGVTGNRGYIPEFQRAHVTAGRVAPFTGQVLR